MQVTQTFSEGLKRQYKVVLPAADLAERLSGQLDEMRLKVRIPGFRPGKVPVAHLKRVYGRSIMADVVQNAVTEANRKIVDDNQHKLANEPQIDFPQDQAVVEEVMAAKGDLEYSVAMEILPQFELADLSDVTLEREVVDVADADVTASIERMAEPGRPFSAKDGAAATGDRVTVDFTGMIDDAPFEGGTGADIQVVLGSGSFIPGFEEQLLGVVAGDARTVKVTFPINYTATHLAGKDAVFDVTVKAVEAPGELVIDDALAKQYGMETVDGLRDAVKAAVGNDYARATRRKLKRKLLDALDAKYTFDLPSSLLEQEFDGIWRSVEAEMKSAGKTFADEDTTEEKAREEYRRIAERRVRLGLVLAEIGEKAQVQVSDDEVTQALVERARQFRGQEKEVWEYYRKNPQAMAELRAPLFEDKVIDHLLQQVTVTEKSVSKEELLADDPEAES